LGRSVLFEDPSIEARRRGSLPDATGGCLHELGTDSAALQPVHYVQIVEERAPSGIVIEDRVREADDSAVRFGEDRAVFRQLLPKLTVQTAKRSAATSPSRNASEYAPR
jgi:hypothetical protein